MNRRHIPYLFLALALLLAPMAAYAAPPPADLAATGASAASPQPPAPAAGVNASRGGASDSSQPIQYASPASFSEGFESVSLLSGQGWFFQNNSSPAGTISPTWFQGNPVVFSAQAGSTDSYIGVNYRSTADLGAISNWMLTPQLNLVNGDTVSFWTRTVPSPGFPDRLQVRLSTAGASTNVGVLVGDVGDFTTLLWDINPTLTTSGYPNVWTQYTITLSGLPINATGRIAWRYYVPISAGSLGNNSEYIGIDTVEFSGAPLAVTLANFTAEAQAGQVLVTWETVSELDNAGFNLYRGLLADGSDRSLLASVPSQAPGSTQGASYSYADAAVEPGQTYWYWLEDIDLNGATTMHGPVSATVNAPTAVTLASLETGAASPSGMSLAVLFAALLTPLAAAALVWRRRYGET
ncbi:MAG: choice-of-anchor J domain-containing protein [Anaerolineae bacterium]